MARMPVIEVEIVRGPILVALEALVDDRERLASALTELVLAMERHPAPKGFCEWTTREHEAVAAARAALTPTQAPA